MSKAITKGLYWRSLEGVSVQAMQLIIQFMLARILIPADFGIIATLNIFVNLANTCVHNGLSAALLQKKTADKTDYCTVFYIENGVAILMYAAIFFASPYISAYYENPDLTKYLRVFSCTILFSSISSIQTTNLRSKMDFRSSFIANAVGITVFGASGITLALLGFGVWSMIIAQLVYSMTTMILLVLLSRWVPRLLFSYRQFRELFAYSWKLFIGWMVGTLYQDAFSLVIGKVYGDTTLGLYYKGNSIPSIINRTTTQITTSVMFPAIAKNQENIHRVKAQTRMMLSVSSAFIFPLMAVAAAVAEPMVMVFLTSKWALAIPIIQIMCIPSAINVINNANMQSFNAVGRSDLFLIFEIVKRSITIILMLILSQIDFYLMLSCISVMGFISLALNAVYNVKLFSYKVKEQFLDIVPYVAYALCLFALAYLINLISITNIIKLCVQLMLSFILYGLTIMKCKKGAFPLIKTMLTDLLSARKRG